MLADFLTRIRHISYWVFLHCGGSSLFSALFGLLLLLFFLRVYDKIREILRDQIPRLSRAGVFNLLDSTDPKYDHPYANDPHPKM